MGGVTVDPVGAAWRDDTDLRHGLAAGQFAGVTSCVGAGVANLHRRGVWPEIEPLTLLVFHVDVEGVLH